MGTEGHLVTQESGHEQPDIGNRSGEAFVVESSILSLNTQKTATQALA